MKNSTQQQLDEQHAQATKRAHDLVDTVSKTVKKKRDQLVGTTQEHYKAAKNRAQELAEVANEHAQEAQKVVDEKMTQYEQRLDETAHNLPVLAKTVHRYPWLSLIVAASVGFIPGLWLKPSR